MNKLILITGLIVLNTSCANRKMSTNFTLKESEISELYNLMIGEFSSSEQAAQDTLFYDINLVMFPIWEEDKSAKWLYVEQAVTANIDKPYRQRVYKISSVQENLFESKVFELENPSRFIHAWDNVNIFNQIKPDSLLLRTGCSVYLKKMGDCYGGSTNDQDCKSSLRGASYATSKVSICKNQIVSWDQGWDDSDMQVWGAETQGYVFKRTSN